MSERALFRGTRKATNYANANVATVDAWVLWAAAGYNLAFGIWAMLLPNLYFAWSGLPATNYPEHWQCIGMIVGVYGIGYAIAATDPYRHWPIVLVGLLGKVLGPIGFLQNVLIGKLSWQAGWVNLTNDLVWWLPFALILWGAYRSAQRPTIEFNPGYGKLKS